MRAPSSRKWVLHVFEESHSSQHFSEHFRIRFGSLFRKSLRDCGEADMRFPSQCRPSRAARLASGDICVLERGSRHFFFSCKKFLPPGIKNVFYVKEMQFTVVRMRTRVVVTQKMSKNNMFIPSRETATRTKTMNENERKTAESRPS